MIHEDALQIAEHNKRGGPWYLGLIVARWVDKEVSEIHMEKMREDGKYFGRWHTPWYAASLVARSCRYIWDEPDKITVEEFAGLAGVEAEEIRMMLKTWNTAACHPLYGFDGPKSGYMKIPPSKALRPGEPIDTSKFSQSAWDRFYKMALPRYIYCVRCGKHKRETINPYCGKKCREKDSIKSKK